MELELDWSLIGSEECFAGMTADITTGGVRFSSGDRVFPIGATLELRIKWPTASPEILPVELVLQGRVVRSDGGETALQTTGHRFRTRQMTAIREPMTGQADALGAC